MTLPYEFGPCETSPYLHYNTEDTGELGQVDNLYFNYPIHVWRNDNKKDKEIQPDENYQTYPNKIKYAADRKSYNYKIPGVNVELGYKGTDAEHSQHFETITNPHDIYNILHYSKDLSNFSWSGTEIFNKLKSAWQDAVGGINPNEFPYIITHSRNISSSVMTCSDKQFVGITLWDIHDIFVISIKANPTKDPNAIPYDAVYTDDQLTFTLDKNACYIAFLEDEYMFYENWGLNDNDSTGIINGYYKCTKTKNQDGTFTYAVQAPMSRPNCTLLNIVLGFPWLHEYAEDYLSITKDKDYEKVKTDDRYPYTIVNFSTIYPYRDENEWIPEEEEE